MDENRQGSRAAWKRKEEEEKTQVISGVRESTFLPGFQNTSYEFSN